MEQACAKCRDFKSAEFFYRNKKNANGLEKVCKPCVLLSRAQRYELDPSYREKQKVAATERNKLIHAQRLVAASNKYRTDEAMRKRLAANQRKRYARVRLMVEFKIRCAVSTGLRRALGSSKGWSKSFDIVGYDRQTLVRHLERQFLTGMSWETYGDWHIDHITPISKFDFKSDPLQTVKEAWALPNLRPLWKADNMRKHAKTTHLV